MPVYSKLDKKKKCSNDKTINLETNSACLQFESHGIVLVKTSRLDVSAFIKKILKSLK